jgi:3-oxoacyl-[acyl-carrier-protein] synthase-3
MNEAYIKALSFFLPEKVLTNQDLTEQFPGWNSDKVSSKVGILSRHIAQADETAADLAEKAARNLFTEYGVSPTEIDFLIVCTQSPDYLLPSTACILQNRLGIPTTSGALDIDLGCSGFIYGLSLAQGLIAAQSAQNILLLTCETYSKYLHPEDISTRSIFGDGAAACLISVDGFARLGKFVFGTDGNGAEHLIVKTGGSRHRACSGISSIDAEGHAIREDFLYMNGSSIFNFTLDCVPNLIESILLRNDVSRDTIDHYVFHQANKYMLNTIRKVSGLPRDKFYINLENTGNTVSSTIVIALKQCITSQKIMPGQVVMIAGFGVGLSWAGTVLYY